LGESSVIWAFVMTVLSLWDAEQRICFQWGLQYDAVSNSQCIALTGRMIHGWWFRKYLEGGGHDL